MSEYIPEFSREECIRFLLEKCDYTKDEHGWYIGAPASSAKYSSFEARKYKPSINFYTRDLIAEKNSNKERFYWLFHGIESYDQIPNCKCGKKVRFNGFHGYSTACCKAHAIKEGYSNKRNVLKDIIDLIETSENIEDIFSYEETVSLCTEKEQSIKDLQNIQTVASSQELLKLYRSVLFYKKFLLKNKTTYLAKFKEATYCIINNISEYYKCKNPNCNNKIRFLGYGRTYDYCCPKCINTDPEVRSRIEQTNLNRYGAIDARNTQEQKEIQRQKFKDIDYKNKVLIKRKETNLKKYGMENHQNVESIKLKMKETNLSRYGVEVAGGNSKVGKFKNTSLWYQGYNELRFLEEFYNKPDIQTITRGPTLKYNYNNETKNYHVDFKIDYINGKFQLVEIKGWTPYFYNELKTGIFKLKMETAIKYTNENQNCTHPMLIFHNEDPITITELFLDSIIENIFTRMKINFEKYDR